MLFTRLLRQTRLPARNLQRVCRRYTTNEAHNRFDERTDPRSLFLRRNRLRISLIGTAVAFVLISALDDNKQRQFRAFKTMNAIAKDYDRTLAESSNSNDDSAHWSKFHERSAASLAAMCSTNGGLFAKFAQLMALAVESRVVDLPVVYAHALEDSLGRCAEMPFDAVRKIVLEELGAKRSLALVGSSESEAMFAEFEETPFAATSVAQLHRATLHDGSRVAVKVLREDGAARIYYDLAFVDLLATYAESLIRSRIAPNRKQSFNLNVDSLAAEFRKSLERELDCQQTADNCEQFQSICQSLSDEAGVRVSAPHVYRELSSKRVLTTELIDGPSLAASVRTADLPLNADEAERAIAKVFAEAIFSHGLVNAAPHPHNIIVRRRGAECSELVFVDHSQYFYLDATFRLHYANLITSMMQCNDDANAEACETLSYYAQKFGHTQNSALFADVLTSGSSREFTYANVDSILEILRKEPKELLYLCKSNNAIRAIVAGLREQSRRQQPNDVRDMQYYRIAEQRAARALRDIDTANNNNQ